MEMVMADGICEKTCVKEFFESLEERQDVRKVLSNSTNIASIDFSKRELLSWTQTGRTFEELFLFVSHQLLHVYCYTETTLIGRGKERIPHVMRHATNCGKPSILEFIDSSNQSQPELCSSCRKEFESEKSIFDVVYIYDKNCKALLPKFENADPALLILITEHEVSLNLKIQSNHMQFGMESKSNVTLNQFLSTANFLLTQIAKNPRRGVAELEYSNAENLTQITTEKMQHYKTAQSETMIDIFEEHVQKFPTKIGLVMADRKYTYTQINAKANQVANTIQATTKVFPDALVSLCLDRTELIIFGILGVWKTGCGYVSIDPNFPPARINLILEDSKPLLILTDKDTRSKISATSINVVDISNENLNNSSEIFLRNVEHHGENLAVVIYTSGTTGSPKGVMVDQRSLVNQCLDYPLRYPDLTHDEVVVQIFNYTFNAFLEPLTLAYSQGLCLVMVPYELLLEPARLITYFVANHVTHIDGTPSLASQYNFSDLKCLKRVAVGGEPFTRGHQATFLKNNPGIRIYNIYGNSEGTLCTATSDVTQSDSFNFQRQVTNKKIYIVSGGLKVVPDGAIGEICFAGRGVSRGYLKNMKLTLEKFIPNPFQTEAEKVEGELNRLYRSGDLGVRKSSGGFEYIGRKDLQVKIRGIRVETSEIETTIMKVSGVIKAAVICSQMAEGNQLIGYFVSDSTQTANEKRVMDFLRHNLPEYMVPTAIYQLHKFPLTPNGKINRHELSPPKEQLHPIPPISEREGSYNSKETAICKIWEDVLSLPPNSVEKTSNFFSLGGNSLLAIKVMNVIKEKLGIDLNATRIMEEGGSFQSFLESNDAQDINIQYIPKRDGSQRDIPLSTSQEQIWLSREDPRHHVSFQFEVIGIDFDFDNFVSRVARIVKRHEILSTIYPVTRFGMKSQKLWPDILQLDSRCRVNLANLNIDVIEFEKEPFDLSKQPPLRVGAFGMDEKIERVVIVVHDIAMDLAAQNIFVEELKTVSQGATFEPESLQYVDYAMFQKNYILDDEAKAKLKYWKEEFNRKEALVPCLVPNKEIQMLESSFSVDLTTCNSLRALAQGLSVSLYSVLLSTYLLLLHKMNPTVLEVTTGTLVSARDNSQVYGMIGNFTHILPFTIEVSPDTSVRQFVRDVAKKIKEAKANQHFPIDVAAMGIGGVRNLVNQSHFRFMFDANGFTHSEKEDEVPSAGLKLLSIKDEPLLLRGTQIFMQVNTAQGKIEGRFIERNMFSEQRPRTKCLRIFEKLAEIYDTGDNTKISQLELSKINFPNFLDNC